MFKNYEKFLKEFDKKLKKIFLQQKEYIKCRKGCSYCCQKGDYPLSRQEFAYLTEGYINLPPEIKIIVQNNIKNLLRERKTKNITEHPCPFLINNECSVYKYRGIICRTFGICYYDDEKKYVRLPECAKFGLNYSEYYDKKNKILNINNVPMINLRIDSVLNSNLAKKYKINLEEIRPMLDWLKD